MFEGLFRTRIIETSDIEKRNAIQEAFCRRNAMDAATIGQVGMAKYVYCFWVKKDQAIEALRLVKMLGR